MGELMVDLARNALRLDREHDRVGVLHERCGLYRDEVAADARRLKREPELANRLFGRESLVDEAEHGAVGGHVMRKTAPAHLREARVEELLRRHVGELDRAPAPD